MKLQSKYWPVIALMIAFGCSQQTDKGATTSQGPNVSTEDHTDALIARMQGTWIHEEDSLAVVEISGKAWTFQYTGNDTQTTDQYTIEIRDKLPAFADENIKADFVVLGNANDTLHYELTGLTDEVMSLMYYPRGNVHVYRKLKVKSVSVSIFNSATDRHHATSTYDSPNSNLDQHKGSPKELSDKHVFNHSR